MVFFVEESGTNENRGIIDEDLAGRIARAFWRRIEPFKNDYEKELPYPLPIEFICHMSTALMLIEMNQPNAQEANMSSPIMKYFEYSHLPEKLQEISKPIGDLAKFMEESLPDGPEKSAGLRKLLEAKDCLVRAKLP